MKLRGTGVSPGQACAPALVYRPDRAGQAELPSDDGHADAGEREAALQGALTASAHELDELVGHTASRAGDEVAEIFTAHRLMLEDDAWLDAIRARLREGQILPAAVQGASDELAAMLQALPDEYLRERAADVVDVGRRVLGHLGYLQRPALPQLGDPEVVLVARDLTPSDTIALDPAVVRGVVTEAGARTSHAAILARQLGIPAIVSVTGLLAAVSDGTMLAIDGAAGACEVDPGDDVVARIREAGSSGPEVHADPVTTSDGTPVAVYGNASTPDEVATSVRFGADGVGLYRTEFLFYGGCGLDDEEVQAATYAGAVAEAGGRPVTFRSLDVGGDKPLASLPMEAEDNPFLGVRGVRLSLRHPDLFQVQLRALRRACAGSDQVQVMVPMVSGLEELRQTRDLLRAGVPDPDKLVVGTMIEVPSAALLVHEILDEVDFVSVGTNDLTQYVLAADRGHAQLGDLYNELHPGVVRLLSSIASAAKQAGKPASVCGEIAGDLRAVPLLVGLGFRILSVAPPLIPYVKQAVRRLSLAEAEGLADRVRSVATVSEVEQLLSTQVQETA